MTQKRLYTFQKSYFACGEILPKVSLKLLRIFQCTNLNLYVVKSSDSSFMTVEFVGAFSQFAAAFDGIVNAYNISILPVWLFFVKNG